MRHISHVISQAKSRNTYLPPLSHRDRYRTSMMNISRSQPTSESESTRRGSNQVNIYALPSENRLWSLIQKYFSKTGQLLPFIHEESFCETYFEMKRTNFTRVRRTWLGLLNIVLAIATSLATDREFPAQKRIEESDIYYQRANALCDRESKRNTSLEMGMYSLAKLLNSAQSVRLILTIDGTSAIPPYFRPVSSGNPKVRAGMEYTWTCYHCSFSNGSALSRSEPWIFPPG
jgi:hypothetical protein